MKKSMINTTELKKYLSKYARRPFGLARGKIHVPENFNDPDPEIEALFEGGGR